MTAARPPSAARRAVVATGAVVLGLTGHAVAGGGLHLSATVAAATLLVAAASAAAGSPARGPLGLPRLVVLLGAAQLLLHAAASGSPGAMPGMSGMPGEAVSTPGPAAMVAAHAGATLVVAGLVRAADRSVVGALAVVLGRWLVAVLTPPAGPVPGPRVHRPRTDDRPSAVGALLVLTRPWRGPPVVAI